MLLAGTVLGPVGVVDDRRMLQLPLWSSLCVSEVRQVAHVGGELLRPYAAGRKGPEGAAGGVGGLGRAQRSTERSRDSVFRGHGGRNGVRW